MWVAWGCAAQKTRKNEEGENLSRIPGFYFSLKEKIVFSNLSWGAQEHVEVQEETWIR